MRQDRPVGQRSTREDAGRRVIEFVSGLAPEDRAELLRRLFAAGADACPPPVPSRRRPRRPDVVTYRVHVDLQDTTPPLWRRLELASDLFLDAVHEIIQAALGWTDSHLHGFARGAAYYSRDAEHYLCPFEVDEGKAGIPEDQVRLDEVLADVGDTLLYTYDFGDDWHHVITLEASLPRDAPARPRTVAGWAATS